MSSDTKPSEESTVTMEVDASKPENVTTKEGKADVFLPTSVFYNPVQEFNRDLTIAVISQHARDHFKKIRKAENPEKFKSSKEPKSEKNDTTVSVPEPLEDLGIEAGKQYDDGIRVLEGLGASGLRSVRFALEIPGLKEVVCNDFSKSAVEFIKKNVEHNKVADLITPNHGDAAMVMYEHRAPEKHFDVIDIDPYGSPSMFLDSAVQSIKDGGILCITCTDMAILCGNNPETCYAKYGAVPLRGKYCHEMALRIVLHAIEQHATCYSRYVVPLLSVSADFYCRVFVRVFTSPKKVKDSLIRQSLVYHCNGCGSFALQPLGVKVTTKGDNFMVYPGKGPPVGPRCEHCNHTHQIGGPIWSGPLHDREFVGRVIQAVKSEPQKFGTWERIVGMLTVISEELPDVPLYYNSDTLSSIVHAMPMKMQVWRSAILNAGYRVSESHAARTSIKTDAPNHVLWDILRCHVKEAPVNERHMKEGTPVKHILSKEPELKVCFDIHPDSNPRSKELGLIRWQLNPQKDWGPQARAAKNKTSLDDRRQKGIKKAMAAGKRNRGQQDFKHVACKKLKVGECTRGEDCLYSHELTGNDAESPGCSDQESKDANANGNNDDKEEKMEVHE